jgi:hypothetical protein
MTDSNNKGAFLKVAHFESKEEAALRYVQQQKEPEFGDVTLTKKWKYYAASKRRLSLQQRKVTVFFK